MNISIIVAASENNVIGANGTIPWKLPVDMEFFKRTTMGHHVVVGRKTAETLPTLKGRFVLVLTRNVTDVALDLWCAPSMEPEWFDPTPTTLSKGAYGIGKCGSMAHAIEHALLSGETELFIAGGAEVYREGLLYANRIYMTRVHADVEGDTYFPPVDWRQWSQTSLEQHLKDDRHSYNFSFTKYERNTPCSSGYR